MRRTALHGPLLTAPVTGADAVALWDAFDGTAQPTTLDAMNAGRVISATGPLTLTYTVGGSATSGADYVALPGSVTIPSGASSARTT